MKEIYSIEELRASTYDEIVDLRTKVETVFREMQETRKKENLEKIRALADEVDISPEELATTLGILLQNASSSQKPSSSGKAPRRQTVPPSKIYRIPETDKTWVGRGKQPNKIKEYIENGGELANLEIKQDPQGEGD